MSRERIDTSFIWSAISYARKGAELMKERRGVDAYERGRDMERSAAEAEAVLRKIDSLLPRLLDLKADADRAYDRFVTNYVPEGCSCHLSAPCSFCTSQPEEAEDTNASE